MDFDFLNPDFQKLITDTPQKLGSGRTADVWSLGSEYVLRLRHAGSNPIILNEEKYDKEKFTQRLNWLLQNEIDRSTIANILFDKYDSPFPFTSNYTIFEKPRVIDERTYYAAQIMTRTSGTTAEDHLALNNDPLVFAPSLAAALSTIHKGGMYVYDRIENRTDETTGKNYSVYVVSPIENKEIPIRLLGEYSFAQSRTAQDIQSFLKTSSSKDDQELVECLKSDLQNNYPTHTEDRFSILHGDVNYSNIMLNEKAEVTGLIDVSIYYGPHELDFFKLASNPDVLDRVVDLYNSSNGQLRTVDPTLTYLFAATNTLTYAPNETAKDFKTLATCLTRLARSDLPNRTAYERHAARLIKEHSL